MNEMLDQHDFMTTYTGRRVNPVGAQVSDIDIRDIAHALSQLCRFTGHTRQFYSVAQHSVLASVHVAPVFALEALLHDAAEAYVNDLSRPLKHHPSMGAYRDADERMDRVVRERFGLPFEMSPAVKTVDNRLVVDEARALLADSRWTDDLPCLDIPIVPDSSALAERKFLSRFAYLTSRQGAA